MKILNKIYNKILFHGFTLMTSPLLLLLIITIIYVLLCIYFFADPIFCQGDEASVSEVNNLEEEVYDNASIVTEQTLNDLKAVLLSDIRKCEVVSREHNNLLNSLKQARQFDERNIEYEEILSSNLHHSFHKGINILRKIRITEAGIKILEPNYVSRVRKQ